VVSGACREALLLGAAAMVPIVCAGRGCAGAAAALAPVVCAGPGSARAAAASAPSVN